MERIAELYKLAEEREGNPLISLLSKLPIKLHPRQLETLQIANSTDAEEILIGGAAGGGKTEVLLVWLAEGVHIPGYMAGVYRRYMEDLDESNNSLLAKTYRLYPPLGGKLSGFQWRFPSGAMINMSGLAHDSSVLKAQGHEYHRLGFDEGTHFTEAMYDFLYATRMRKMQDFPIKLGVMMSANPGGPGHLWVKNRFITEEAIKQVRAIPIEDQTPNGMVFGKEGRLYIPSRAADNLSLDVVDYINRMLKNKNPVERARMMNGDWGIAPEGLIKAEWLRYYTMRDKQVDLLVSRKDHSSGMVLHTDEVLKTFHEGECRRFITVDTAGGSEKEITEESKGRQPSFTVAMVWDYKTFGDNKALILKHVWRDRVGFTDVASKLLQLHFVWNPTHTYVEAMTMGPDLQNLLKNKIPISTVPTMGENKVSRAAPLLNMMMLGQVYFPQGEGTWRIVLESEMLSWQGIKTEVNDQIDAAAYAPIVIGGFDGGAYNLDIDPRKSVESLTNDIVPVGYSRGNKGWGGGGLMKGWG